MSALYRLDFKTEAGAKVAEVSNFLEFAVTDKINEVGLLTFTLRGNHPAIDQLARLGQIELWHKNAALDIPWQCFFYGLWLEDYEFQRGQQLLFKAQVPSQRVKLSFDVVAFKASTANRARFVNAPAETVAKALVGYNLTSAATIANGRIYAGGSHGITVEADGGHGTLISDDFAFQNVLDAVQDVASNGGGDFDLVKIGAASWEFRWYAGQLGADHSDDVLFSLGRGNMANPRYIYQGSKRKTVSLSAGSGQEDTRDVAANWAADYAANRHFGIYVDAQNDSDNEALASANLRALEESRQVEHFTFEPLQTPGCAFGKHYFLGDLAGAYFNGESFTVKVNQVVISMGSDGKEAIRAEAINI